MPRKKRLLVDGGIYHVYNRGNDRQELFREENDYIYFYKCLLKAKLPLKIDIFHYCLMPNHFHLLVRVSIGSDLSKLMHQVQLTYACHFQRKYGAVGHVFQERFRSPLIPEESYYLQCGRYIERNPVSAGMVGKADDYRYSSARYYVKAVNDPLVTKNLLYETLGATNAERQQCYREILASDEPYRELVEEALVRA